MNIKTFVDDVLCIPVTVVGNKYITEAIEIVVDTHEHKFYGKLCEIHNKSAAYIETAIRSAKNLGLHTMTKSDFEQIFGENVPTNSEFIIKSAEYYRRTYENKEKG